MHPLHGRKQRLLRLFTARRPLRSLGQLDAAMQFKHIPRLANANLYRRLSGHEKLTAMIVLRIVVVATGMLMIGSSVAMPMPAVAVVMPLDVLMLLLLAHAIAQRRMMLL